VSQNVDTAPEFIVPPTLEVVRMVEQAAATGSSTCSPRELADRFSIST